MFLRIVQKGPHLLILSEEYVLLTAVDAAIKRGDFFLRRRQLFVQRAALGDIADDGSYRVTKLTLILYDGEK